MKFPPALIIAALFCSTAVAAPESTVPESTTCDSPCDCHDAYGEGRWSVKTDASLPPTDASAIQAVTPSEMFGWPGPDAPVTMQSERTGIENKWFALTGRVVELKVEEDGDLHVFESTWDGLAFLDRSGERSGVVIARGSSNAKQIAPLISESLYCVVWTQNDEPGRKFEKDLVAAATGEVKRAKIPEQYKDLNDWTRAGATADQLFDALCKAESLPRATTPTLTAAQEKPLIQFVSPAEIRSYQPPEDALLVGDYHIVKGGMFIIAGAPGVGKSRAIVALAQAGALKREWFGLSVHRKLRIMIIQTENGMVRLRNEFLDLNFSEMDECVRISPPPPFGLCFKRSDFREQLAREIAAFGPQIVIIDPWISATSKDKAEDYLDTLTLVRSVLPEEADKPALGIVAHTRKPLPNERANGRALLHMIAGSFTIGAVARSVFVLQSASDDTTDNRVVWTCCKNNDGELGARSAWERRNGLFESVSHFDWQTFDNPPKNNELITESVMESVFEDGPLTRGEAVKKIMSVTHAGKSSAYNALSKFNDRLLDAGGRLSWT
jgi:AAA domain